MFRSDRDYKQTCAFFKILHKTVHISINNIHLQKMLHDDDCYRVYCSNYEVMVTDCYREVVVVFFLMIADPKNID